MTGLFAGKCPLNPNGKNNKEEKLKETNQYKKMNAKNMKIIYIWKAIEETNMKAIPAVIDTT